MAETRWKRGVAVGTTATVVQSAGEPVERALLGRTPRYHASAMAEELVKRLGPDGAWISPTLLAMGLRWGGGAAFGVAYAAMRPLLPRSRIVAGSLFGAGLLAFHRVVMPLSGLTPRVTSWPRDERRAFAIHVLVWALTAAIVDGRGRHE